MLLKNITLQVVIAGTLAFFVAWLFADSRWISEDPQPLFYQFVLFLKTAFLGALRMLIAPLIFFSLIGGIIGIGNVVRLRALGGVTVGYYLGTTSIAISLGLVAVFFIHPWTSYPSAMSGAPLEFTGRLLDPDNHSIMLVFQNIFSQAFTNPFTALSSLNILGIVTNAFLLGIAMVLVLPSQNKLFDVIKEINQVISKVLSWIIMTLPVGIFAIIFDFTLKINAGGAHAPDFVSQLLSFGILIVVLTLIHGMIVLPAIGYLFAGRNPLDLLKAISRPLLVAFSTSSSSATLPVSMRACDETLKLDKSVTSFVLPLGATMNMDGTALFEAVAAVFLAYLYGIELSTTSIFVIFFITMLASIGAPGMPSASMAGMQMVLLAVGIPLEAIAILLVIERPLDTIRTAVNVEGDLVGAAVVQSLAVDKHRKPETSSGRVSKSAYVE